MKVVDLAKYFPVKSGLFKRKIGEVKAVDGVSLAIKKGETLGLVGESGCGKTTLAKTIIRIYRPDRGRIYFDPDGRLVDGSNDPSEKDITTVEGEKLRFLRRHMQIVYQNPSTSLNPRMLVKDILAEPLIVQGIAKGREAERIVAEELEKVGLSREHMYRYPHEFSGGQKQRIAIARAIITRPKFVVLDEPTSSVDVSVRASIITLLQDLQGARDLTYLFVSHDLAVVQAISHRIGIMYLGKLIELAETGEVFANPLHPYTRALLESIPIPDPEAPRRRRTLSGEVPSALNPPRGCRFHPRCPYAMEVCKLREPTLRSVGRGHYVACFLYEE